MKYVANNKFPQNPTNRRKNIPRSIRYDTWYHHFGDCFNHKCYIDECRNQISVRPDGFHAGHNIPYSEGGEDTVDNLRPICAGCNCSMGTTNMLDFMKKLTNN